MTTEERLEKLERELGRAKRHNRCLLAGLAVCLGIGGVAWAFRPEPARAQIVWTGVKEVRANRFILEDKQGKARAQLTVYSDGPRLSLFDQWGKVCAELAATEGGARLALFGQKGEAHATMSVGKYHMVTGMTIRGPKTGSATYYGPTLGLYDVQGNPTWCAPTEWRRSRGLDGRME